MNTTLMGGRLVKVTLLDGTEIEVKVRQLPLGEYDRAFPLSEDEIALVAFICEQPKSWADILTPESYELLFATAQEVNAKGFFAFCRRRIEANLNREALNAAALAQLPEAARRQIIEQGAKMIASQNSSDSSSTPRPRRV